MSSPFTLTIDWLSFTLPSGTVKETMELLEGEWIKSQAGFRGYPLSWMTVASDRGVGKLGTGAPRAPRSKFMSIFLLALSRPGRLPRCERCSSGFYAMKGISHAWIVPWTIGPARCHSIPSRMRSRPVSV